MARIKYIGKKRQQIDRLGGSGYVWNGPGSIVEVQEPEHAARFLSQPSIWVEAPAPAVDIQEAAEAKDDDAPKRRPRSRR